MPFAMGWAVGKRVGMVQRAVEFESSPAVPSRLLSPHVLYVGI